MKIFVFLFTLCLTGAAQAQDSIDIGAAQFARQCTACHVVRDDEGNILVGNSGRAGPNLYGAMGRTVAGVPNFRYGDSIVAARQADVTWTQDNFCVPHPRPQIFSHIFHHWHLRAPLDPFGFR